MVSPRAPFARHASVVFFTSAILVAWLGACNDDEACGAAGSGALNGTCQVGPTCPSGSTQVSIADPADECPGSNSSGGETYICCAPKADAGSSAAADSGSKG